MNFARYLLETAPDGAVAVIDASGRHTYGGLRSLVVRQQGALHELGLEPGTPVALHGVNSPAWVAAYLAILASGLVAVPLPHTLEREQARARMDWIGARAAFLDRRAAGQLTDPTRAVLPLEATGAGAPAAGGVPRIVDRNPDDDALYAFTSGTTGRPRAVRHTHRNLLANTASILEYLELLPDERALVVLPFSYVFGASVLHTHLRVGGALVLQNSLAFPQAVVERMAAERCTGVAGVPSTFHMLLRNSEFAHRVLPDLRTIQQAGGKLAPPLIRELVAAQPQARVFVMYGQTEATARLSYLPPEDLERKLGSIGRGIPGVTLRVVDTAGRPVPPGVVGEIWARGDNVSPGYLGDPAETARKMPDGELHTGDLARVDEDGYIFVVDRQEDFIKSWGHRIASQDVEAVAIQLPELVAVAAVGVPDDAAGERVELVAVRRPGVELDEEALLRHCRLHLSKYMVPVRVRFVPSLPLNENGKVSKPALRDLCQRLAEAPLPGLVDRPEPTP